MSASDRDASPPSRVPFIEDAPRRCAVILNPKSGNGKAGRQWAALERKARALFPELRVFPTTSPGHATELTRRALHDGFDRIVSAGGDGTHYEVVNGFFEDRSPIRTDASFALLPVGTASDLRKTYALPKLPDALDAIASPRVIEADVGRVWSTDADGNERVHHFNTAVHMGIGSLVNEHVNRRSKVLGGFLTFLLGVVTARLVYRSLEMTVETDSETITERFLEVIVANGFYDGGGMHVAPRGTLNSGMFEVYAIGAMGPLGVMLNIPRMYLGTQDRHPAVHYFRAKRIAIHSVDPVLVGPDGEVVGRLPAHLEVVPKALRVVTGPNPRVEETASTR